MIFSRLTFCAQSLCLIFGGDAACIELRVITYKNLGVMKTYRVVVVGATGAVGRELLQLLEARCFPMRDLRLVASPRSAGNIIDVQGRQWVVEPPSKGVFDGADVVFLSAGSARSKEYIPWALESGALVIDNSSAFRMAPEVPLVVPEINRADLEWHSGLVANPNCTAAILAVATWPLHRRAGIRKMIVSTYQAASGAGASAMRELTEQTEHVIQGRPVRPQVFPHPIAFNLFSHNAPITSNGCNEEENKIIQEIRKIFHEPRLHIAPTCVRVPVLRAHSASIVLELEEPLTPEEARYILQHAPGIELVDHPEKNHFPMPIEATGRLNVLVGRVRQSAEDPRSLSLFVCGDQLLKGAAWNALQIAEELLLKHKEPAIHTRRASEALETLPRLAELAEEPVLVDEKEAVPA